MDPMSSHVGLAKSSSDGKEVYVELEPGASMFLFFSDREIADMEAYPFYTVQEKLELPGPWSVQAIRGFQQLPPDTLLANPVLWSELPGEVFKRFAGTCEYATQFYLDKVTGIEAGVLWSFSFEVKVGRYLKEGKNELRVEVSNLGANAIRDLDRREVNWKKFHDIYFVNLDYQSFDASNWEILPSGLDGTVELILLKSGACPE